MTSSPDPALLLFKDRAPWLVLVPVVLLLIVSTVVMIGPMFSDRNRMMMVGLFPLFAYLIFRAVKKACVEFELPGDELRIKTNFIERRLSWQQVHEITIQRKKRTIKLKTDIGEFVLPKTFGKMEELFKHLEYRAAAHQIKCIAAD